MSRNVARYDSLHPSGYVAPREGRVSRNDQVELHDGDLKVAPREGRVSRNVDIGNSSNVIRVAPREGRVSRNPWYSD